MAVQAGEMLQGSSRDIVSIDDDDEQLPPPLKSSQPAQDARASGKKKEKRKRKSEAAAQATQQPSALSSQLPTSKAVSHSFDFRSVTATSRFPLGPVFAQDPLDGARQCLQSWMMRYVPSIDGVLVSFEWPPEILQESATLAQSSAYALVQVQWTGCVFRPQIGSKTTGRLSLATPSTISLLLHNLFNASISTEHIPRDQYEWDPEARLPYSLTALTASGSGSQSAATQEKQDSGEEHAEDVEIDPENSQVPNGGMRIDTPEAIDGADDADLGCWVHKETREPLGGSDGQIEFTVIGLTIANSMISAHGSLLKDPSTAKARHKKDKSKKRKAGQPDEGQRKKHKRDK